MAVEIKYDASGDILSRAIEALQRQTDSNYNRKTQEINNNIAMAQAVMSAKSWKRENDKYREANFLDAAGYDNPLVMEWLQNMKYSKGGFERVSTDENESGWQWTGPEDNALVKKHEAWEKYKSLLGGQVNSQDHQYFDTKLWNEIIDSRHRTASAAISSFENQGYNPDDIRWIIANNSAFDNTVINLESELDAGSKEKLLYSKYIPRKDMAMTERWKQNAPWLGLGGMGAAYGLNALLTPDAETVKTVTETFESGVKDLDSPIAKAKKAVEKAKKRKATTAASKKTKKTLISKAQAAVEDAKKLKISDTSKLHKKALKEISESRPWERWKLSSAPVRTGAAFAAPFLLSQLGGAIGGDRGAAIGQGVGGVAELSAGAASGSSLGMRIAKMMAKKGGERAVKAGALALADSPLLPFGDLAALGLMGYGGVSDIMEAYKMWQEDSARRKSKKNRRTKI